MAFAKKQESKMEFYDRGLTTGGKNNRLLTDLKFRREFFPDDAAYAIDAPQWMPTGKVLVSGTREKPYIYQTAEFR